MERLIMRLLDPDENGGAGGGAGASEPLPGSQESLQNTIEKEFTQPADDKPADKPADDENKDKPADKPADDKSADDKAKEAAAELEEVFDLEHTDKDGKPVKLNKADLLKLGKWYVKHADMIGGAAKIRDLAAKNPNFAKLFDMIVTGSFNEKDEVNTAFIDKTMKALEAKEEKIEAKVDEKNEEIIEAEKALEDLDPDSPQAKALRSTIAALKASRKAFQDVLTKLDQTKSELDKRIGGMEDKSKTAEQKEKDLAHQEEVKRVSGIFEAELGAILDPKKQGAYEFADDVERQEFDHSVRDMVAKNAPEINKLPEEKRDEAFKKSIGTFAKALYEKLSKRREHWNIQYATKKGWQQKTPEKQPEAKPADKDMNLTDLMETVEKELADVQAAQK